MKIKDIILNKVLVNTNSVNNERIKKFKQQLKKDNSFWITNIDNIFKRIKFNKKIIDYQINYKRKINPSSFMSRIKKSVKYKDFKKKFINPNGIHKGVDFWKKNKSKLNTIEKKYLIPPEIIVSIIGIETIYGSYLGNFIIINSLYTLAFNNTSYLSEYGKNIFTEELKFFLKMCKKNNYTIDKMFKIKGSFSGAIGIPQFLPSNIENYAKDGNNDKIIDLFNEKDAIESIAFFLTKKGWIKKGEIVIKKPKKNLIFKENESIKRCKNTYIYLDKEKIHINENFCILKRYNNSNFYAMAVYELGEELKKKLMN